MHSLLSVHAQCLGYTISSCREGLTYSAEGDAYAADLPRAVHEARPHSHARLGEGGEQGLLRAALALEVARQKEVCTCGCSAAALTLQGLQSSQPTWQVVVVH